MDYRREPMIESEQRKTAPTLAEFAKKSQITEDRVWELIEEGQVSARFVNEAILIMQDLPSLDLPPTLMVQTKEPTFAPETRVLAAADPVVSLPKAAPKLPSFLEKSFKSVDSKDPDPEFQKLDIVDNSAELLAFAQDALSHNCELSKELLVTKNEVIKLKDERIAFLSDLLSQRDREIRSLNRNLEELATLSNFEAR